MHAARPRLGVLCALNAPQQATKATQIAHMFARYLWPGIFHVSHNNRKSVP